ncbi:RecB-like helicase [Sulfurimonas aquatica]|uniref:DNA 3'-5' helicase n=2 Tax=Sulfurimonas aquatica TaxID=2672570 RepID=A0A975GE55_9BACT|nr:RecB-like helicase [Sulfurimonas aquatica]
MFKNNLAYEASAGSGKTFMLVVRYLSLLFMQAEPSKILALTFTNKAASEMSERIVETLEELESRGELDVIMQVTGLSREHLLANRKKILQEFLNSHTKIMTIDSFFTQVLRKFSLYASLMPDFSTFSSQHELKLMSRFLSEVSAANKREILINLSLESKKRISDIFTLLDEFYIKKEELSNISFTKIDLRAFEDEAMSALSGLQGIVANCDKASGQLQGAVKVESFAELKDKTWVQKESLEYWAFKKCFTLEMNHYLHTIQTTVANHHRAKEQNFFYALNELVEIYQKSKKALYMDDSELSFSDVTSLVYEILHKNDDSQFLYFRLDAKIEHILLDEFQDTSVLQYKILKPLIEEITSGNGIFENGSFFFVGDVKQSIYRFRGGVSALFGEVVEENDTEVEKLLTNYRSQKEVIEFVNATFRDKIEGYSDQLVRKEAQGGYVEVLENDELLEETLTQVQRLIALGADLNEIAILCATNGDGEAIKLSLQENEIEVVTETTTKLINQRSVKALLEYLKYLYFKEDIYKHNFFALISQEIQSISSVDFNKVKLFDVVKRAIEKYNLFEHDFHLLRFLNAIKGYEDIEALLFEYERLDTSAAASDLNGVRVLTVHKSKGLEYAHVIVMDRLKNPPASRSSIIYEYDGIALQNVYLRTKNREAIDRSYENALHKEQKLVREDSLNALYVAFTRARENLIIIKKSKKSSFDLLELDAKSSGELQCERVQKEKKKDLQPLEHKELYYGTQSDILALESEQAENINAINFGLALHYMLEMMSSFNKESIPNAKDMMINKFGFELQVDEIEDIVRRVEMFVENEEVLKLIDGDCYREKALRYKNNLRYVDLLVKHKEGSWNILDYKSSLSFSEHHVKQVRYYKRAIEDITAELVNGYICYILADSVKLVKI